MPNADGGTDEGRDHPEAANVPSASSDCETFTSGDLRWLSFLISSR